jgi:hypothetical protein
MLNKILGAGVFLLGLLIIIRFPDITRYQPEGMGKAGIIIGLILTLAGLYLMKT